MKIETRSIPFWWDNQDCRALVILKWQRAVYGADADGRGGEDREVLEGYEIEDCFDESGEYIPITKEIDSIIYHSL